jgi:hypothetical protein
VLWRRSPCECACMCTSVTAARWRGRHLGRPSSWPWPGTAWPERCRCRSASGPESASRTPSIRALARARPRVRMAVRGPLLPARTALQHYSTSRARCDDGPGLQACRTAGQQAVRCVVLHGMSHGLLSIQSLARDRDQASPTPSTARDRASIWIRRHTALGPQGMPAPSAARDHQQRPTRT